VWLAAVFVWIWHGPAQNPAARADYALVLGAAVVGDRPSPVYAARIDHGIALWRAGRVQRIVFTGGRGPGDDLSEAAVGQDRALAAGVPAAAIVLETSSRTTRENLRLTRAILSADPAPRVLIVSDPLHMVRATQMADDLGYAAQPSATPLTRYRSVSTKVPFALRELYFLHHYWLLGA